MWKNAFQKGFSKVQCLNAWDKIGAAQMTRACLSEKQVRQTFGDTDDETDLVMHKLNYSNYVFMFTLSMWPYRGYLLSVQYIE